MAGFGDWEQMEYQTLMSRGRDAERTAQVCWTAAGIAAAILFSWGIAAKSSSLMLPVVFATAFGFYSLVHGRNQVRLIAGYVKEHFEGNSSGARWFTRLEHLEGVPGFNPSGDWLATALATLLVGGSIVFAWIFSSLAPKGEMMAGIVTGVGLVFCFHAVSETARLRQTNPAALWRQVGNGVEERRPRLAAR
jgi:hypothetical protein